MVGSITSGTTAETTETTIRDRFVAFVGEKNTTDGDFANASGPVTDEAQRTAINGEATGDTYTDKGNTLWDANAGHLKTNLEKLKIDGKQIVNYETLSDEQKVALDTYANISGTGTKDFVKAYKAAVDAVSTDPLADAMKMVYERIARFSGKMAREINEIDGDVDLSAGAGAAPAEDGDGTGAVDPNVTLSADQRAMAAVLKDVGPLLQTHAEQKDELATITASIADASTPAATLEGCKKRLTELESEIAKNNQALAAQKDAVGGLKDDTSLPLITGAVTGKQVKDQYAAATPLEATRAAQAVLVDGAIKAAAKRDFDAEVAATASFDAFDETIVLDALKVDTSKAMKGEDYLGTYHLPMTWVHQQLTGNADFEKAVGGRVSAEDIKKYLTARPDIETGLAHKYAAQIRDLVVAKLHADGYSDAKLESEATKLNQLIADAATNAHTQRNGKDYTSGKRSDKEQLKDVTLSVEDNIYGTFDVKDHNMLSAPTA